MVETARVVDEVVVPFRERCIEDGAALEVHRGAGRFRSLLCPFDRLCREVNSINAASQACQVGGVPPVPASQLEHTSRSEKAFVKPRNEVLVGHSTKNGHGLAWSAKNSFHKRRLCPPRGRRASAARRRWCISTGPASAIRSFRPPAALRAALVGASAPPSGNARISSRARQQRESLDVTRSHHVEVTIV
jgi:hypothetical protein